MTLAEVLPAARSLSPTEKLKLIRILAEDLDKTEDISPLELGLNQESKQPRTPGLLTGKLGDTFFEPLPEEELQQWE
jgi:hypothetical protein